MGRDFRKTFDNDEYRFGKGERKERRRSKRKFTKDHLRDVKNKNDWEDFETDMRCKYGDSEGT
jgi:hypothetical protein